MWCVAVSSRLKTVAIIDEGELQMTYFESDLCDVDAKFGLLSDSIHNIVFE